MAYSVMLSCCRRRSRKKNSSRWYPKSGISALKTRLRRNLSNISTPSFRFSHPAVGPAGLPLLSQRVFGRSLNRRGTACHTQSCHGTDSTPPRTCRACSLRRPGRECLSYRYLSPLYRGSERVVTLDSHITCFCSVLILICCVSLYLSSATSSSATLGSAFLVSLPSPKPLEYWPGQADDSGVRPSLSFTTGPPL